MAVLSVVRQADTVVVNFPMEFIGTQLLVPES